MPLWGQKGEFEITVGAMRVRIVLDGLFGICGGMTLAPGFAAHAGAGASPAVGLRAPPGPLDALGRRSGAAASRRFERDYIARLIPRF